MPQHFDRPCHFWDLIQKNQLLSTEPFGDIIYLKKAVFSLSKVNIMRLRVMIEQDEDGTFVAECPALPGCISQGKTRNEAVLNIKDAMKGYMESLKKHNEPIPPPIYEEVVEVNA